MGIIHLAFRKHSDVLFRNILINKKGAYLVSMEMLLAESNIPSLLTKTSSKICLLKKQGVLR